MNLHLFALILCTVLTFTSFVIYVDCSKLSNEKDRASACSFWTWMTVILACAALVLTATLPSKPFSDKPTELVPLPATVGMINQSLC